MNKKCIEHVLSLSCVENHFLGYFQFIFDVRMLFVKSFVSMQKVLEDFLLKDVKYENFPLERLQTTSEKIGMTGHEISEKLKIHKNELSLIRVNRKFFEGEKTLPWREDHYIAIEKQGKLYYYLNNYPLSDGGFTAKKLVEIYDNACLNFRFKNKFLSEKYSQLSDLQYENIMFQKFDDIKMCAWDPIILRNAMLVLKTLRKRLYSWLEFEEKEGRFNFDLQFHNLLKEILKAYEKIFILLQLQIARNKSEYNSLSVEFDALIAKEMLLQKIINTRRVK